ncbi:MAG: hypothetical protein H6Q10_1341 [Acidobacteria bacterium]|nr:hypothetical protein [Acidobacteriota bacterium]
MTVKRKKRVLVIDDEPAMTDWLKAVLAGGRTWR